MKNKRKKAKAAQPAKRSVSGKFGNARLMQEDSYIRSYIPQTKMLTKDNLRKMLLQYKMVYVKPTHGSQGRGVIRVERHAEKKSRHSQLSFTYQLGRRKETFPNYNKLYYSLAKTIGGERYLVQRGINLLKHKGRSFDIRLVVQRTPRGGWEPTGTVGRVAPPRKIVTNGSQGGTIYPTDYLLRNYLKSNGRARLLYKMDRIALRAVKRLNRYMPKAVDVGVDLALDRNLKPWILELNTRPDPCPFALLPNKSMLRKILRYGRANGKRYSLNCVKAKRGL